MKRKEIKRRKKRETKNERVCSDIRSLECVCSIKS